MGQQIKWKKRITWTEEDVIRKDRIRDLNDSIFGWIDGNILHGGLLEEMTDHEFKLYGLYCLAGSNLYGLSCCGARYICKVLKMTQRELIKARKGLVEKDLIAYQNREFVNSKRLKYKKCVVQVLSLPFTKVVAFRKRVKDEDKLTTFERGLRKHYLTIGFGRFMSEEEQDRLLVEIMRDDNLDFETKERIKSGIRRGEIRRTVYKLD